MTHRKADLRVSFKRLNDRELPFEPSPIRSPKDLDGIIQTRSPAPTARRTRRRVRFADPEPESEAPQLSDEVEARLTTFGSLRLSQRSSAPGSPVGILDGLCASLPEDAEPGSSAAGAADAELRFWDSGSDDLTRAAPGSRPRRPQAALPRRLEALRWSAADAESGPPSPGLDCFGQWPAEIAEEEGPEGPANPGARPPEAYQMAVRAAMLAWEDPSATLAERVRLADMLRAAFGVTKAAHLRAMRSALRQNACAAEELEARTLGTDEEFVEDEAWARWWEAELRELQALLRQQRRLPRFNAMLEVAVLEASNLREKKLTRKLGVVKRLDEVQHYGLVEVAAQRPVSRRRNADRGSRAAPAQSIATSLRTGCSRGQNPAWHCKTRPVMLHRPPQSLRVSVCTRGMFSDEQDAPPDGNGASPATMAVDIPSPHGHQVLGRSTLHLAAEGGDPETSFLLPVHCQAPLMRKRSGLKAKPPKHVGTLAIVVRYVPEMRQAASYHGDSVGRTFSTASAPAAPSSRVTSSGSAASSLSACSGPSVLPADREPATPHLLSSNDASQTYELLASLLWECWKRGPPPFAQECHGHTFVVGQGPGGIPSRVRSRLSVESGAGTGSGSGGGHATGASEGDGDLSGFCPGRPWNGILDAAAKLYRVRGTWRRLVMVKLMLGDWRLEVDYLAALQRLWEPVVAIGRNGEFTKREAALHAECSRRIVSTGVRALETYPVSLGRGRAAAATVLRSLLALISLAVRYDTDAGAMLEPLKTHIRRSVRWQMSESLPKDDMTPDECIEALSGACLRAASGLRRDLEVADAFPSPLDLPAFTAGLRYAVLARHALELFTGPGVVAYDKRVMELHDRLNELHNLMVASGVSRPAAPGDGGGGGSGVALLSLDKLLGRSILKWARDVGLNMRDWADSAIAADKRRAWRRVSQGAFVSPSVVDLMHIISEVIERAEDRSAGLEETGRLRAEVFERLQAGIHHVVRRYATVLGELFCEDLSQAERRRLAALASTNPRGLETAAQPPSETAQSRPCVGERACVFLSNLSALHDGLGNAHSRLVTAAFGDAFPSPPASPAVRGGAPIEDDAASASLSDISFISDEPEEEPEEEDSALWDGASDDSAGAEAVASSRPADFAFWDRPGEDASGLGPDGRPAAAPGGTVLMEARRSLQRLCGATSRAVAAILGSCSSALASAIKAKVRREVVALLRPVRDDAASQSEVMQGPFRRVAALQGVLASLSWSRDGRRDQAVAPEPNSKGASQLADEELESFMDGLLDREICLLSQNLPPSAFRDAVATAFCSLLAALEDLVLGTTRHCGPLTPPEGRLLARVLEAACAWFHCGGDGLPLEELHQLSQRLRALLELHSMPVAKLELEYNRMCLQGDSKVGQERSQPERGRRSHSSRQLDASPRFHESFRREASLGPSALHLLQLARQRSAAGDGPADELYKRMRQDVDRHPLQLLFGRWRDAEFGRWRCLLTGSSRAWGEICVAQSCVAFFSLATPASLGEASDALLLMPLDQVARVDYTYKSNCQCLMFTMLGSKASHTFSAAARSFADREAIHAAVCRAAAGTGWPLEETLAGFTATEGPESLGLPPGEEVLHVMECSRLAGGGMWYVAGVLYVCKGFVLFDASGTQRITVRYTDILEQKLEDRAPRPGSGSEPRQRLVLLTRDPSVGRLTLLRFSREAVQRCMTCIACGVAGAREYIEIR